MQVMEKKRRERIASIEVREDLRLENVYVGKRLD